ncbi:MAG: hypothetical protein VB878_04035 [Pirellulaceae bacterium]
MHHHQLLNLVRQQVHIQLIQLGASEEGVLEETILIRDGMYCGRRFFLDDFMAIWFIEEGELKFFDPSGAVAAVEQVQSALRAA